MNLDADLWQAAFDEHVGNEPGLWRPDTCMVCRWMRETMPNEIAVLPWADGVPPTSDDRHTHATEEK